VVAESPTLKGFSNTFDSKTPTVIVSQLTIEKAKISAGNEYWQGFKTSGAKQK